MKISKSGSLEGMGGIGDKKGADLEISCEKCGRYLTIIKLNPYCKIDILVECSNCGNVAKGNDLWGEPL